MKRNRKRSAQAGVTLIEQPDDGHHHQHFD